MVNECYEWRVNDFYDVVAMKMKFNWNFLLYIIIYEDYKSAKAARKAGENSTRLH